MKIWAGKRARSLLLAERGLYQAKSAGDKAVSHLYVWIYKRTDSRHNILDIYARILYAASEIKPKQIKVSLNSNGK